MALNRGSNGATEKGRKGDASIGLEGFRNNTLGRNFRRPNELGCKETWKGSPCCASTCHVNENRELERIAEFRGGTQGRGCVQGER